MYELEQAEEYREIPVKDISKSEESVKEGRGDPATDHELRSLMEDIKINGLTHPPTVEETPKGPKPYQTIVGSRRLVAVEQLGMKKIKCLMRPNLSITGRMSSPFQRTSIDETIRPLSGQS